MTEPTYTPKSVSRSHAMRVLIVDDDDGVCRLVQRALEREGILCTYVYEADAASARLADTSFDLVVLDVEMPGRTGWDLLEDMRSLGDATPVIYLSAHHGVPDRVRGLNLGADDFVQKPFRVEELVARVNAVIRRRDAIPTLTVAGIRIDMEHREVTLNGARIETSPREFAVLSTLAQARGEPVSKTELLREVWGTEVDPGTKIVEVQVARLRRKFEKSDHDLIETLPGRGYRLRMES
jgi:DNA-binding response OmpR family regulator